MWRSTALILFLAIVRSAGAQPIVGSGEPPCATTDSTNSVRTLYTDSLCSSFLICIPHHVAAHYHRHHTEHVFVLDGTGEMLLGDSLFRISPGQSVVVPKGTTHAVRTTSPSPLRVISVQSPQFDGSDRIPISP